MAAHTLCSNHWLFTDFLQLPIFATLEPLYLLLSLCKETLLPLLSLVDSSLFLKPHYRGGNFLDHLVFPSSHHWFKSPQFYPRASLCYSPVVQICVYLIFCLFTVLLTTVSLRVGDYFNHCWSFCNGFPVVSLLLLKFLLHHLLCCLGNSSLSFLTCQAIWHFYLQHLAHRRCSVRYVEWIQEDGQSSGRRRSLSAGE